MKIVFLDAGTLGDSFSFEPIEKLGEFKAFEKTAPSEVVDRISDAEIVITNKVLIAEDVISKSKNLKLVISAATGTNHIDKDACAKANVDVMNVSNYSTDSVAQHTFSMLFHLLHSNRYFDDYTSKGEWEDSKYFTHLGREYFEIKGKRWGIIGLGTIGSRVAELASCFGAKVSYYSSSGKDRSDKYERVELEELLKQSDIVSIHAPLTDKTENLLNKNNLGLLEDNSILLNLGRGGIINEEDLVGVLQQGKIFVGLDVLENEPMKKNSPLKALLGRENLFITPHIAWSSKEARKLLVEKITKNIKTFLGK